MRFKILLFSPFSDLLSLLLLKSGHQSFSVKVGTRTPKAWKRPRNLEELQLTNSSNYTELNYQYRDPLHLISSSVKVYFSNMFRVFSQGRHLCVCISVCSYIYVMQLCMYIHVCACMYMNMQCVHIHAISTTICAIYLSSFLSLKITYIKSMILALE